MGAMGAVAWLAWDGVWLLLAAHLALGLAPRPPRNPWRYLLGLGTVAAGLVVALGLVLGYAGWLSPAALTAGIMAVALALALPLRSPGQRASLAAWGGVLRRRGRVLAGRRPVGAELALLGAVLLVLGGTFVYGVFATDLIADNLAYRLPRIAMWLQEGSIRHFPTLDPRMNVWPPGGELLQLWVLGHFAEGYPLAFLPSWLAGTGLCVLFFLFCHRTLRLGRGASLGGVLGLLTLPNVTPQLATAQIDLLTAFFAWYGLCGAWWAVCRGLANGVGPLAFAVALAAKGTTLYFAAAFLPLVVLAGGWRRALRRPALATAALAACLAALIAGPHYAANVFHYGHPAGPEAYRAGVEKRSSPPQRLGSVFADSYFYFAQNAGPFGQPWFLREPFAALEAALLRPFAVADDPSRVIGAIAPDAPPDDKVRWLRARSAGGAWSPDAAPFGWAALLTLGAAWMASARARRWWWLGLGAALFVAQVAATFFWSGYAFRLFVLVSPALALGTAFLLAGVGWMRGLAVGALAWQGLTGVGIFFYAHDYGWAALATPAATPNGSLLARQRGLMESLPPGTRRVALACPDNLACAGLFRHGPDQVRREFANLWQGPHVSFAEAPAGAQEYFRATLFTAALQAAETDTAEDFLRRYGYDAFITVDFRWFEDRLGAAQGAYRHDSKHPPPLVLAYWLP